MVRSRNRFNRRRLQNRPFPIRGRGSMRRTNRKVVVLNRRPRRNVAKRLPVLGYAAGGTCTTIRTYIKDYDAAVNKAEFTDIYQFKLAQALKGDKSCITLFTTLYTNFQIQRITFRVISCVGSSIGGVACGAVFDHSMGVPAEGAINYTDMISRGGATAGKIWQDMALEWVPTEPADLNYKDAMDNTATFAFAALLSTAPTEKTKLGILVADIHLVARTINTVDRPSLIRKLTEEMESDVNVLHAPADVDDAGKRLTYAVSHEG